MQTYHANNENQEKHGKEKTLWPVETISMPLPFPENGLWEAESCSDHLPVPPQGWKP